MMELKRTPNPGTLALLLGWPYGRADRRALDRALCARKPRPGLLHHSDRGRPYASEDYLINHVLPIPFEVR
jgi:hypothetical protein